MEDGGEGLGPMVAEVLVLVPGAVTTATRIDHGQPHPHARRGGRATLQPRRATRHGGRQRPRRCVSRRSLGQGLAPLHRWARTASRFGNTGGRDPPCPARAFGYWRHSSPAKTSARGAHSFRWCVMASSNTASVRRLGRARGDLESAKLRKRIFRQPHRLRERPSIEHTVGGEGFGRRRGVNRHLDLGASAKPGETLHHQRPCWRRLHRGRSLRWRESGHHRPERAGRTNACSSASQPSPPGPPHRGCCRVCRCSCLCPDTRENFRLLEYRLGRLLLLVRGIPVFAQDTLHIYA